MKITIPITPVGQMRARSCIRGRHAGTYKAKTQAQREESLAALLAPHRPVDRLVGPLMLGVKVYLPIPKSKPKRWQQEAREGLIRPTVKPDLDNCIKHLKDVLTGLEFWEDDKQVVEYLPGTGKWYSDNPRWEIEIVEYMAMLGKSYC